VRCERISVILVTLSLGAWWRPVSPRLYATDVMAWSSWQLACRYYFWLSCVCYYYNSTWKQLKLSLWNFQDRSRSYYWIRHVTALCNGAWGETCCDWFGTTCSVAWHSGGTLVFDWRTFIVLRSARLQLTGDHLGG